MAFPSCTTTVHAPSFPPIVRIKKGSPEVAGAMQRYGQRRIGGRVPFSLHAVGGRSPVD